MFLTVTDPCPPLYHTPIHDKHYWDRREQDEKGGKKFADVSYLNQAVKQSQTNEILQQVSQWVLPGLGPPQFLPENKLSVQEIGTHDSAGKRKTVSHSIGHKKKGYHVDRIGEDGVHNAT